jgi:organic radical activating enzyme
VKVREVLQGWGRILSGRIPFLSIEITRECPLACPGCYAYNADHLGGPLLLREVSDYRGEALVQGILRLVDEYRPLQLSLVGGEPLVRFRELTVLMPQLEARGIYIQVVTSAVRPIPQEWRHIRALNLVVSIDGLQPEHDIRRKPATYDRILNNIAGHRIAIHCTITRQMTERPGYLREFLEFWTPREEVRKIWMSIFTPQKGETSSEILPLGVRRSIIAEISVLAREFPKLQMPDRLLDVYRAPPENPSECLFARTTRSVTADLRQPITPCQFGGDPDCSQCGCVASAGLGALARRRLPVGIRVGTLYEISYDVGQWVNSWRKSSLPT